VISTQKDSDSEEDNSNCWNDIPIYRKGMNIAKMEQTVKNEIYKDVNIN
jgi:hypothetical protein